MSGKTNRKLVILTVLTLAVPLALAGCLGDQTGDNGQTGGDGAEFTGYLADCVEGLDLGTEGDAGTGDGTTDDNQTGEANEAGDGGEAPTGDGITIGTILPITGALQAYGPSMEQATDLAAQQLNEAGGILGGDVNLAHADSASDPNQAPQAFNQLVNQQNVIGIVGAASSGVTSTLMSLAADNKVLLVSPASTSPALNAEEADGYFFRVVASDELQGEVLAGLIEACGDAGSVNTIAVNNDYGTGFVEVLANSMSVGEEVFYGENQQTFDSEVQSVCSGNPSAIGFIGYPQEGSVIMQQAYAEGCTDTPWYFSEGLYDPAFPQGAGQGNDGNNVIAGYGGTAPWTDPSITQSFVDAYTEEFGSEPGLFAAQSYDSTILIALAAQMVGSTDNPEELISAMESLKDGEGEQVGDVATAIEMINNGQEIDWVGPSGQFTFDENHTPGDARYAIWMVGQDGSIQNLETGIAATAFTG